MIAQDMAELGTDVLVNLASNEYWGAAQTHIPSPIRVISIDFREEGPNGLRFNSFAAKRARGMMARYMCEHHLSEPESLKSFDSDGYVHDPDGSEENIWRFVRRRSEEHTSELQSLMRTSYAVFCLKNKMTHLVEN